MNRSERRTSLDDSSYLSPEDKAALSAQAFLDQAAEEKRQARLAADAKNEELVAAQRAVETERLAQKVDYSSLKDQAIRGRSTAVYQQLLAFLESDPILNHMLETIWAQREPATTDSQIIPVEKKAKNWFEAGIKKVWRSRFIEYKTIPSEEIPLEPLQQPFIQAPIPPEVFFESLDADRMARMVEFIDQCNALMRRSQPVTLEDLLAWVYQAQFRTFSNPVSLSYYPPFRPPIDAETKGLILALSNQVSDLLASPSAPLEVHFSTTGQGTPNIDFHYSLTYDLQPAELDQRVTTAPSLPDWKVNMILRYGQTIKPVTHTMPLSLAKKSMYKVLGEFIVNRLNVRKIKVKLGEENDPNIRNDWEDDLFFPTETETT